MAEELHQRLAQEVNSKVAEKMDELWQKGKQMMSQAQLKQKEQADQLTAEVSHCLDRQQELEAETTQLKQLIADLSSRLSVLGSTPRGCEATPNGTPLRAVAGVTEPGSSSQSQGSPSDLLTPVRGSGAGESLLPATLPEVPAFPFPSAPQAPQPQQNPAPTTSLGGAGANAPEPLLLSKATSPAPLLLSKALSPSTSVMPTPPKALSLANSLLPAAPGLKSGSSCIFSFTLRKADETDLGLNVSHLENDKVLFVEGVRTEGAVDAWNRQCMGSAFPEKAVMPGDRIFSVNGVTYNPEKMLEECKDRQLLRLSIARGDAALPEVPVPPTPTAAAATAGNSPGTDAVKAPPGLSATANATKALRADASEFVPGSAVSSL